MPTNALNHSPDLGLYLRQIPSHELLTREEEQALGRQFRSTQCMESRDKLVCSNLRLVVFAAKRYAGIAGVCIQDLVEAGNVGLIHAAERFDPDRGVRFSVYAMWWIKKSMLQVVQRQSRSRRGQIPLADGAADCHREVALDDLIEDKAARCPSQLAEETELQRRVLSLLVSLDQSLAGVVRMRFGLEGHKARSLQEIGDELGIGVREASRMLTRALAGLKGHWQMAA
jgi:RNA polymerase sigma factor (sigma-70 family)